MKTKKGFSLVEILIVIAIIAGIAGIVVSNLDGIFSSSKQQIASLFVNETIKTPLIAYKIQMGDYPDSSEGLQALLTPPKGKEYRWNGPYIESIPLDPWGNDYNYNYPGINNKNKYDIWSNGSPNNKKKIGNW